MSSLTYHAVKFIAAADSQTACGLKTGDAGASTNSRARVTCAACLERLKTVAHAVAPEPIAYVAHQPKATPAKAIRKKTGDLPTTQKPQDGFNFGGATGVINA